MTRRSRTAVWCMAFGLSLPSAVLSQAPQSARPAIDRGVLSAIDRARGMTDRGEGVAARRVLDSLVHALPGGSDEFAEALYWRAVLADRASDAEQDWKLLAIDAPLSPRMPDALLWLGELALVRGHHAEARRHLQRLLRDYSDTPVRAKAMLWIARGYFEEGDRANGCAMVATLRAGRLPEGEIRLQANEMENRCAQASMSVAVRDTTALLRRSAPDVSVPNSAAASKFSAGKFSVQLAAYGTRTEATRMVKRLAARGVTARIDGTRKPFRVRAGRYDSEAAANTALAALKKRGMNGFVATITP